MKNERKFEILQTPNFYFPILQKGKKFRVIETYTLDINYKKYKKILKWYEKSREELPLKIYAGMVWEAIQKEKLDKTYKNCWIVPLYISNLNKKVTAEIDILKPC